VGLFFGVVGRSREGVAAGREPKAVSERRRGEATAAVPLCAHGASTTHLESPGAPCDSAARSSFFPASSSDLFRIVEAVMGSRLKLQGSVQRWD